MPGRVRCVGGGWWSAGKDSPCSGCLRLDRDNFLPARLEWAGIGVFCCVGRVLYRFGLEVGDAGRVLYRGVCAAWVVGGGLREKILPARARWAEMGGFSCAGRVLYRLALRRGLPGEFCTGLALRSGLLGEFCTGCGHACRVPGEFCTGACALRGWWVVVCGRKFALQGVRALQTRNFSPSVPKIGQNERFLPCWASFFAVCAWAGVCWACCVAG